MVSIQNGSFVPVPFSTMINPETGKTRVRRVDVGSLRYAIARRFMVRLTGEELRDPRQLARLAEAAGVSSEEFAKEFGYLADLDPTVAARA
jgi:6-phosphofructokinase 1